MRNADWHAIRPWKGSQSGGFQELCVQLARAETPEPAKFILLGAPDARVECYCILPDDSEWGWQKSYAPHPQNTAPGSLFLNREPVGIPSWKTGDRWRRISGVLALHWERMVDEVAVVRCSAVVD